MDFHHGASGTRTQKYHLKNDVLIKKQQTNITYEHIATIMGVKKQLQGHGDVSLYYIISKIQSNY